ncbi:MAG TPA: hypothetical protein VFI31_16960 [Pirellulales bacterium]|nr:hypothetical protein [Pirellulales bacterium]
MQRLLFVHRWFLTLGVLLFLIFPPTNATADEPKPSAKPSLVGVWQATLKIQTFELRVVLRVTADGNQYRATLDSPDQGAKGIQVDQIVLEGNTVKLELKAIKASFKGKLADDAQTIQGKWTQAGTLPLDFKRLDKEPDYSRPQEPKKPYPYLAEDVTYKNGNRDVAVLELAGLNHLFQHCQTGSPAEYGKIDETVAPQALQIIGDWILEQCRSALKERPSELSGE